jgi:cell pole-organizing protein PopZ
MPNGQWVRMSEDVTTKGGAGEPSMEEILASIRQIINQNDQPADAGTAQPADTAPEETEVLELTNILEDTPAPAPEPVTPPEPVVSAPEPSMEDFAAVIAPTPAPPPAPAAPLGDGLISGQTAVAAAGALGALANTLAREKMEHSLPMGNGMRTLESMVVEAMKPLLKEWLDQNLAGIVERIVQAEVEKLTKRLGG